MERTHELLTGERVNLSDLSADERDFLQRLSDDATRGVEYFELLRRVKGPDALPLRGGRLTPEVLRTTFFRAAHDIADRAGIEQGFLLTPEVAQTARVERVGDLLSLTEAAELIGITRPAAHQALLEKRLRGQRVGNAWVVRRRDAEEFARSRRSRSAS